MTADDKYSFFESFPILKTKRLLLREFLSSDAESVLVYRGDPEVQKYDDPPLKNVDEVRVFIEETRARYLAGDNVPWAVTFQGSDAVIGGVGFHNWNKWHHHAELGFGIAKSCWGQGVASEAVDAINRFGFETMRLNRIEAYTRDGNVKSVRLLERLGFQHEGTRRERVLEDDGKFYDSLVYGLLKREFQL